MSYGPYSTPGQYGQFGPGAPPAKTGMSVGCIVGIIAAVVLGGGTLVCCGGSVGIWMFSVSTVNSQVERQLRANPVVLAQLGELRSCSFNIVASSEHSPRGNQNTYVFDLKGTRGDGQAVVQCDGNFTIQSGTLTTPTGGAVPLMGPAFPAFPPLPGMPPRF